MCVFCWHCAARLCVVHNIICKTDYLNTITRTTKAGVAMGLARIAGTAFAEWGPAFQTLMMAIIMLNMLAGPPCFRTALIQVMRNVCVLYV